MLDLNTIKRYTIDKLWQLFEILFSLKREGKKSSQLKIYTCRRANLDWNWKRRWRKWHRFGSVSTGGSLRRATNARERVIVRRKNRRMSNRKFGIELELFCLNDNTVFHHSRVFINLFVWGRWIMYRISSSPPEIVFLVLKVEIWKTFCFIVLRKELSLLFSSFFFFVFLASS